MRRLSPVLFKTFKEIKSVDLQSGRNTVQVEAQ